MYGIFTYIYHKKIPIVGKHTLPSAHMGMIGTNSLVVIYHLVSSIITRSKSRAVFVC